MPFGMSLKGKPKVEQRHVERTQKSVGIIGKILAILTPLMLLVIIGLSVAPVAGVNKGWAYYSHNNIAMAPGGKLRILVGWLKFHTSAMPGNIKNKDVGRSGEILGAITAAWLLMSALTAAGYMLLSFLTGSLSKSKNQKAAAASKGATGITQLLLTLIAPIIGLGCILLAIALYIVLAVNTATYSRNNLGPDRPNYMAWPDWAFFLAVGAGLFWLLLAPLTAMAAATAGASAGLEGRNADEINNAGRSGQSNGYSKSHDYEQGQAPQRKTEMSGPPAYINKTKPTPLAMQGQNADVNRNDGYSNNNGLGYDTGNGHLDNVNGYVIDHNRHRGDLAEETYTSRGLV